MMIKHRFILPLFLSMLTLCASAQDTSVPANSGKILKSLDLGFDVATTGIGLTVSVPVGDIVRVRGGFDYMPHTSLPFTFEMISYLPDAPANSSLSADDRFNNLAGFMQSFTGMKVDKYVDTKAHGNMCNFKLLVDVFPIKDNKHWYATAGFYWGNSKVGHAENTAYEAPSMMGVLMYNYLYDYFYDYKYFDESLLPLPDNSVSFPDPMTGDVLREKFMAYGRIGAQTGYFKEGMPLGGKPYMMTPDENGTIRADMFVNNFRPYLGLGYTTEISKDGRWHVGVDAGAFFWGKPKVYTHERYLCDKSSGEIVGYGTITDPDKSPYVYGDFVDLVSDVDNVAGKLGDYVDVVKSMHVYPVLNFRLSYKLF